MPAAVAAGPDGELGAGEAAGAAEGAGVEVVVLLDDGELDDGAAAAGAAADDPVVVAGAWYADEPEPEEVAEFAPEELDEDGVEYVLFDDS